MGLAPNILILVKLSLRYKNLTRSVRGREITLSRLKLMLTR
jgi:hypothetical protein